MQLSTLCLPIRNPDGFNVQPEKVMWVVQQLISDEGECLALARTFIDETEDLFVCNSVDA